MVFRMKHTGDDSSSSRDWGGAGGGGTDTVLTTLSSLRAQIKDLNGAALWARTDEEARDGVDTAFTLLQQTHALWLGLVADLDSRPDAVPKARAGSTAKTFLMHKLHRTATQATADVRAAHTLASDANPATGGLPHLGEAFTAGDVSREHVDVATRVLQRIPKHLFSKTFRTTTSEQNSTTAESVDSTDSVEEAAEGTDDVQDA